MSATEPSFARMAQAIRDGRDQDAEREFRALIASAQAMRDAVREANIARYLANLSIHLRRLPAIADAALHYMPKAVMCAPQAPKISEQETRVRADAVLVEAIYRAQSSFGVRSTDAKTPQYLNGLFCGGLRRFLGYFR